MNKNIISITSDKPLKNTEDLISDLRDVKKAYMIPNKNPISAECKKDIT